MKKIVCALFSILLINSFIFSLEEKYVFDEGIAYFPQVNGEDDLSNIRIEYDNGDIFYGRGTKDGIPLEGDLENERKQEYYSGKFDENERYTGFGELETPVFQYTGNFLNGKRNGFGTCFYKQEKLYYEGNFVNGNKEGEGIAYKENSKYSYKGSWKNNQKNGYGELITENGAKYSGYFVNDEIKGDGLRVNSTGEILKGNWTNSEILSGTDCSYIATNGTQYHGEIVDGKYEGAGRYVDSNGTVYEGSFCENQRTGFGQQLYPDGSVYTGYYFGNQRNKEGIFEFSNGYTYEGGFLNGVFYGNGFLSAEENEEITIIASEEWNGLDVPENSDGAFSSEKSSVAKIALPRSGKILFSNGDMWEGYMNNGCPIAGLGIWTTQEERLARIEQKSSGVVLCSYQLNNNNYDLSSVYTDYEVSQIISSDVYLASFTDYYRKHKATIDKVVGGLQTVAAILTILPNPIQPIAAAVDIGLSIAQISLKTMTTSEDIYNACVAGNKNLIPGMLKDYGKDIVWDAINIILATPGSGEAIGKLGKNISQGMGKAGAKISEVTGKAISKNQTLAHAAAHLGKLAKAGKASMKSFAQASAKAPFFNYVAKAGGRVTFALKKGWISVAYPKLFKQYGDDAVKLIFKHGDDIARELGKNGDILVRAFKTQGDDVARLFLKNGDAIATAVRASEYPDAIIKFINKSGDFDNALHLATTNKSVGKFVNDYGDKAIKWIDKYDTKALKVFDITEAAKTRGVKILNRGLDELEDTAFAVIHMFTDKGVAAIAKHGDDFLSTFGKVGVQNQDTFMKIIARDGDEAVTFLKNLAPDDLGKTIGKLENVTVANYKSSKLIESSNKFIGKLSLKEQEAIGKYTTKTHRVINRNIRNGHPDEYGEILQKVLTKSSVPEDVKCFRGVDGFVGDSVVTMRNGKFNNLPKPGEVISNKAFTSTSISPKYAGSYINSANTQVPVLQEIVVPKGANGLYISDFAKGLYGPKQQELLLNAGSKFKVVETTVLEAGTEINGVVLEKATALVKMVLEV